LRKGVARSSSALPASRQAARAEAWLASAGRGAVPHLWIGKTSALREHRRSIRRARRRALEAAAQAVEGVTFLDKVASVTRLFGEYRKFFSYGLAIAIAVVLQSSRVATAGAAAARSCCDAARHRKRARAYGYGGVRVTLFTVMALMLVLGVGVNYAIFWRRPRP